MCYITIFLKVSGDAGFYTAEAVLETFEMIYVKNIKKRQAVVRRALGTRTESWNLIIKVESTVMRRILWNLQFSVLVSQVIVSKSVARKSSSPTN